jgi:hypothetical protein
MENLRRSIRGICTILVVGILMFGASQANAAVDEQPCIGDCPPLTPGEEGTCWEACVAEEYAGGDCTPSPPKECCCFIK